MNHLRFQTNRQLLGGKIVIGIDPAKASHQAAVVNATGAWVAPYGNASSSPDQTEAVPDFDLPQSMGVSFPFKPYPLKDIGISFKNGESFRQIFGRNPEQRCVWMPRQNACPEFSFRGLPRCLLSGPL